jgi:hypothetical protein
MGLMIKVRTDCHTDIPLLQTVVLGCLVSVCNVAVPIPFLCYLSAISNNHVVRRCCKQVIFLWLTAWTGVIILQDV